MYTILKRNDQRIELQTKKSPTSIVLMSLYTANIKNFGTVVGGAVLVLKSIMKRKNDKKIAEQHQQAINILLKDNWIITN